jgi:hypothetical protein
MFTEVLWNVHTIKTFVLYATIIAVTKRTTSIIVAEGVPDTYTISEYVGSHT